MRVATTIMVPAQISIQTNGHQCRGCDRWLVTKRQWEKIKLEVRSQLRKEFSIARGRSLCSRCYINAVKNDTLADFDRQTVSDERFVEDYKIYHRRTEDHASIANLMDMSHHAFDKAYDRAKKRGDL